MILAELVLLLLRVLEEITAFAMKVRMMFATSIAILSEVVL